MSLYCLFVLYFMARGDCVSGLSVWVSLTFIYENDHQKGIESHRTIKSYIGL